MTKMQKAEYGYEIQVGDVITCERGGIKHRWTVHRVTKKYAFILYNDTAEG